MYNFNNFLIKKNFSFFLMSSTLTYLCNYLILSFILGKQLKNKWSRSILNRSSSMNAKESNIYKQTLHNDLINYDFDEYEN